MGRLTCEHVNASGLARNVADIRHNLASSSLLDDFLRWEINLHGTRQSNSLFWRFSHVFQEHIRQSWHGFPQKEQREGQFVKKREPRLKEGGMKEKWINCGERENPRGAKSAAGWIWIWLCHFLSGPSWTWVKNSAWLCYLGDCSDPSDDYTCSKTSLFHSNTCILGWPSHSERR